MKTPLLVVYGSAEAVEAATGLAVPHNAPFAIAYAGECSPVFYAEDFPLAWKIVEVLQHGVPIQWRAV